MQLAIALASSIGVTAVLATLIVLAGRRLRLIRLLAFPLWVGAIAAGLKVYLTFEEVGHPVLDQALSWLLIFLIIIVVLRVLSLYLFQVYLHTHRGLRLPPLLPTVAVWTAYILTGLILLPLALPAVDVTPILATSAVTSLVLGLALQPILGNFFSGVVISLERPFRINDWIKFDDTEGRVVNITWRTTHLRNRNNDDLVIPNAVIAQKEIINYFFPHPLHLDKVYVGVHYRTPPYRVRQAILTALQRVDKVLEKPSPQCFLIDFGESALIYEVRSWIEDIAGKPAIENDIRSEIWDEFRRQGLTIPFPIRTLEIEPRARKIEIAEPMSPEELAPRMAARLFVAKGPAEGSLFPLAAESVTAGRSHECDIQLDDRKTSGKHFRLDPTEDGYLLTDLESRFGVQVNGVETKERLLRDLDRLTVGDNLIIFESHE